MKYLILSNSIAYGLRVKDVEVVIKPGLNYQQAKDWMTLHKKSLQNTRVIILIGPVRFTKKTHRREVVLNTNTYTDPHSTFNSFYTTDKNLNIYPILCTIYPMNFTEYNSAKCKHPIRQGWYDEWNNEIKGLCVRENRKICAFNEEHNNPTPYIHRRVFKRKSERQQYVFRSNLLTDGLHPKKVIVSEWGRELTKVISKMRGHQVE